MLARKHYSIHIFHSCLNKKKAGFQSRLGFQSNLLDLLIVSKNFTDGFT